MQSLQQRVGTLEQRVAVLEGVLRGVAPHRVRPALLPRTRSAAKPETAPSAPQRALAVPSHPRPVDTKPRRDLEADFGRLLLSRLGGISLVVAVGFLFHYVAKRGWIGPEMRLALGTVTGLGLIGGGEWIRRRLAHFSAALTGSGVAILYICAYAGYALYGYYGWPMAMLLAVVITVGALAQALRHDVQAIAGLAGLGGFFAPIIVQRIHQEPLAVLGFVLVLNVGLCFLRLKRGWRLTEWVAWVGTPVAVAVPLTQVELGWGIAFLLSYVSVFAVRPRLRPDRFATVHVFALSAVTAGVSWLLFQFHESPGWAWFAGGLAAVLAGSAWLGEKRREPVAWADLTCAAALAALAIYDGFDLWRITLGWSLVGSALLLVSAANLAATARWHGRVLTALALLHLVAVDAVQPDVSLIPFLAVAGVVAANRDRRTYWLAVALASIGLAAQIAEARGLDPWLTLILVEGAGVAPSSRLIVAGTVVGALAVYGAIRRSRRGLASAAILGGMLVATEVLYGLDGVPYPPPGLYAGTLLLLVRPRIGSAVFVAVAMVIAAGFDLLPPDVYLPFLNRRFLALGSVIVAAFVLWRGREERPAATLAGVLLLAAEVAAIPDTVAGNSPWPHLAFFLETAPDPAPYFNSRFLFLAGAAVAMLLVSRRWRPLAVLGHLYIVAAVGAEAVGLVDPALRAAPLEIFKAPGQHMGHHLALTGVILGYGALLVTAGILRDSPMTRRIGLALLVAGAAKVSLVDLTALGDLYRVGSFVVLGGTFLFGSYAYNRWLSVKPPPESRQRAEAA